MNCSVCGKDAPFLCGHGCDTGYCGRECALSVYKEHKEECVGVALALVGSQWVWNSAEALYADFSRFRDPGQRQQRVQAAWQAIRQEEDPNVTRQWNMFNRASKQREVDAHKAMFRAAIALIVHNGASQGYTEHEKMMYGSWASQMV